MITVTTDKNRSQKRFRCFNHNYEEKFELDVTGQEAGAKLWEQLCRIESANFLRTKKI